MSSLVRDYCTTEINIKYLNSFIMIRVVSLLGNYRSIDKNKQVCGQNENFNAKKIIIMYHVSCFWILVNLP